MRFLSDRNNVSCIKFSFQNISVQRSLLLKEPTFQHGLEKTN